MLLQHTVSQTINWHPHSSYNDNKQWKWIKLYVIFNIVFIHAEGMGKQEPEVSIPGMTIRYSESEGCLIWNTTQVCQAECV